MTIYKTWYGGGVESIYRVSWIKVYDEWDSSDGEAFFDTLRECFEWLANVEIRDASCFIYRDGEKIFESDFHEL